MTEFETWWSSHYGQPLTPWEELRCPDGYAEEDIDKQFEAWKAAKSQWIKCSERLPEKSMNKLIDEYDLELQTDRLVVCIDLYGVTEDEWGYILRCDDSPDFFSVYRIEEKQTGYLLPVCVGDFSDIEDAKSYANRLCEKYSVKMVNDCSWHTKPPMQ